MIVRPLVEADDAPVAALARVVGDGWSAEELARERARAVARVLVADEGGVPRGYVIAWVIAGEAEVLGLAVDPGARRRGVGRALLAAALAGVERAHLEVRADNVAARALYEGFGFVVAGRRRAYYADGQDALLMAWGSASP